MVVEDVTFDPRHGRQLYRIELDNRHAPSSTITSVKYTSDRLCMQCAKAGRRRKSTNRLWFTRGWQTRGKLECLEVVAICDHPCFLLCRQLKHEIGGKAVRVALHLLVQALGAYPV